MMWKVKTSGVEAHHHTSVMYNISAAVPGLSKLKIQLELEQIVDYWMVFSPGRCRNIPTLFRAFYHNNESPANYSSQTRCGYFNNKNNRQKQNLIPFIFKGWKTFDKIVSFLTSHRLFRSRT